MEKKTEAVNANLIKNSKGEGGKKSATKKSLSQVVGRTGWSSMGSMGV